MNTSLGKMKWNKSAKHPLDSFMYSERAKYSDMVLNSQQNKDVLSGAKSAHFEWFLHGKTSLNEGKGFVSGGEKVFQSGKNGLHVCNYCLI